MFLFIRLLCVLHLVCNVMRVDMNLFIFIEGIYFFIFSVTYTISERFI